MKRINLRNMTVEQLMQHFTSMALQQDKAILYDEITKYNRLYKEMEAVETELKARKGDERRALIPLLKHSNAWVRLKAAIATLAIAPDAARQTLQNISDSNGYPEAADARGILRALDQGRYKPT